MEYPISTTGRSPCPPCAVRTIMYRHSGHVGVLACKETGKPCCREADPRVLQCMHHSHLIITNTRNDDTV